ncbi:MAG: dTDP-4-dehydrorhamnose reductase [Acidobacteria bacterium]|nr:dTDP-4-dehydrorhamnose reductase [Acidobacteriota bacterium]
MAEPRVLITGAAGLLGRFCAGWFGRDRGVLALSREDLDITSAHDIDRRMDQAHPSLVINCAAMANVDACERDPVSAGAVNVQGPRMLAEACERSGSVFVHISTDFVFDGGKREPYTIEDPPRPLSRYGASKLGGETEVRRACERHFIIRASRIFGPGGRNFLSTLITQARRDGRVIGVVDEVSIPTYARDLAMRIDQIVKLGRFGTYHLTNEGPCSWYEAGTEALRQAGLRGIVIEPARGADLGRPAVRPAYSAMRCLLSEKLGLPRMRDWREAYAEFLEEYGSEL